MNNLERTSITLIYEPTTILWHSINDVLARAHKLGSELLVARHLVGAYLERRFHIVDISGAQRDSKYDADIQGDFIVGNTVFQVAVVPTFDQYEAFRRNVALGYRSYVLVPHRIEIGVRQMVENLLPGRITVDSVESFVSQGIETTTVFHGGATVHEVLQLVETYNHRIREIDPKGRSNDLQRTPIILAVTEPS